MAQVVEVLRRNLVFVSGKGGVGKTVVSQAIAHAFAQSRKSTLWVTFEDPRYPLGETVALGPFLSHLNCESMNAFEEYAALKIGATPLTRLFLRNKLMRYLAKAAPGIHELVLLGKVWHERTQYRHVVVDMPSTGYGLAMFQSTQNFSRLFRGGPVHKDAEAMLQTFGNAEETGHLILGLPEEMPLLEALELNGFLNELFPENPAAFLVNRLFPGPTSRNDSAPSPSEWASPVPVSAVDYVTKRIALEDFNLRLWRKEKISYGELDFVSPALDSNQEPVVRELYRQLEERRYIP